MSYDSFIIFKYQFKCFVLLSMLLACVTLNAQSQYLKNNERLLMSFKTTTGKQVAILIDSNKKYIVYRFGNISKVELEYPTDHTNSFEKFRKFYYARYGGPSNAGTVINQIEFTNGDYTYKIYDQSFMLKNSDRYEIGLTVVNNKTRKASKIKGLIKSQKGSLGNLQNIEEIQLSNEPFDH